MFKNREEAGIKLAQKLKVVLPPEVFKNALVLAIPRGGVTVGGKISQLLNLPLDCLITKKLPAPGNEELAIGAVAEGGVVVWEEELCQRLGISLDYKQGIVRKKIAELERKKQDFRGGRPTLQMEGKVVIITDDGVATGSTMKAAIAVARNFGPSELIVAIPVIAKDSLEEIKREADRVIFLEAPEIFFSVGQFYENFEQISDEAVRKVLKA